MHLDAGFTSYDSLKIHTYSSACDVLLIVVHIRPKGPLCDEKETEAVNRRSGIHGMNLFSFPASSAPVHSAVFGRREAVTLLKGLAELVDVRVTAGSRYICDGIVREPQPADGMLIAKLIQVLFGAAPVPGRKGSAQIDGGETGLLRQFGDAKFRRKSRVQLLFEPASH